MSLPHVTEAQRAAVARVLDQARREVALEPYEAQRERKDGSRIDVVSLPGALRDAEGRLTGSSGSSST